MSAVAPSQKYCEKKLREIRVLKQKQKHNKEEFEKIQKEEYYENMMNRFYRKRLHVLPDDVQQYIWDLVDINTKLNLFRTIYTPDYITSKFKTMEHDPLTIKQLFSCMKYVKRVFTHYLKKNGAIYQDLQFHLPFRSSYPTTVEYFMQAPPAHNKRYYIDILISIIIVAIKNYTKMYATGDKYIHETEKDIMKLFVTLKNIELHP
jgi:hypothetical protein